MSERERAWNRSSWYEAQANLKVESQTRGGGRMETKGRSCVAKRAGMYGEATGKS